MALQKHPININFSQGLDNKTDPKQVQVGKFLGLKNAVFGTDGLLQKRNGYAPLSALTNTSATYLTTLNGNLTAIGSSVLAYIEGAKTWVEKGTIAPLTLSTLPLIRNSVNQTQADTAISPNGLVCTVYTEVNDSVETIKYAIADAATGQNVVSPAEIPVSAGVPTGSARVFAVANYFIIVFTNVVGPNSNLQYVAISAYNPTAHTANTIASSYTSAPGLSWDGVVAGNQLFIGYNTTSGGQAVKLTYLTAATASISGTPVAAVTFASEIATNMSLCADVSNPSQPIIYSCYYDSASSVGKAIGVDQNLNTVMTPTSVITTGDIANVTSAAQDGVVSYIYEVNNTYTFSPNAPTNYVAERLITRPMTVTTGTVSPAAGSAASGTVLLRSVGLASKAVVLDSKIYFLTAYDSLYQPTYFLVTSDSTSSMPKVVAKLAYQNGGGYTTTGLPSITVLENELIFAYLFKDLIAAVSKATNVPAGSQVDGVYSQTGVNMSRITIGTKRIATSEIAGNLHISGGFLWHYDGYLPVEHNFFVYPDDATATWSETGGNIAAKPDGAGNDDVYFYYITYEWADNQGNIYRSAPSVPISVTTTGSGTTGSITLEVPTLRLTYKTQNIAKIVIYRGSAAQETCYQVTSITSALLNDTTVDSVEFVDTMSNAAILGNSILYTTGGVIEDLNAPASSIMTLFDNRLFLVDAEDPNLLWFSKEVIEAVPVEMSDLLTLYVAPTIGVQGSTGPITALAAMDDKLIIFKKNAIYYVNGRGPDNTGAQNQYSQPIFITSTVGCDNPASIVLMHSGIMFQSDKGIWTLGRDCATSYVGAAVELYNTAIVQSAVNVPETTQVRFTLDTGITLMYDYYYQQWGTFEGVPAISSCVFESLHTYLNSFGQVYQESSDQYLDGASPVLMSFTTSWLNLAGLQGYERFYFGYILGTYYTPFKLNVQLAYDYATSPSQNIIISPDNYSANWGAQAQWGSGAPWGGPGNVFEARFFPKIQKCSSFQVTIDEVFDPSLGVAAGQGLSMSGLNLEVGMKRGFRTQSAARSFGK